MPISGSTPNKVFSRSVAGFTGSDAFQQLDVSGRAVLAVDADESANDLASGINAAFFKDGSNINADIPLNANKFTGVENAAARTDFAAAGQIADGALIYAGTSSGTDTITASLSPAVTALVAGMLVAFKAGGTNTGAATFNLNSVGATNLRKGPDAATTLAAGDITTGGIYLVSYTGSVWHLLNPKFPAGFATTDSPQFSTIELGAASDTTLSRSSAGVVAVEGTALLRASQNLGDVSSAATAFGNIKQAATDSATGVAELATVAEMVTGTDTGRIVVPGRQHHHPGHPKVWSTVTVSGGTPTQNASYNVTSITDAGVGALTITIANDFDGAAYAVCYGQANGVAATVLSHNSKAAGSLGITSHRTDTGAQIDPAAYDVAMFGTLA